MDERSSWKREWSRRAFFHETHVKWADVLFWGGGVIADRLILVRICDTQGHGYDTARDILTV